MHLGNSHKQSVHLRKAFKSHFFSCYAIFTRFMGLAIYFDTGLIDEANINIETIRQATIPESPPWQLESPLIIYGLKTVKKVDTNPLVFQGLFNDVQDTYFDH